MEILIKAAGAMTFLLLLLLIYRVNKVYQAQKPKKLNVKNNDKKEELSTNVETNPMVKASSAIANQALMFNQSNLKDESVFFASDPLLAPTLIVEGEEDDEEAVEPENVVAVNENLAPHAPTSSLYDDGGASQTKVSDDAASSAEPSTISNKDADSGNTESVAKPATKRPDSSNLEEGNKVAITGKIIKSTTIKSTTIKSSTVKSATIQGTSTTKGANKKDSASLKSNEQKVLRKAKLFALEQLHGLTSSPEQAHLSNYHLEDEAPHYFLIGAIDYLGKNDGLDSIKRDLLTRETLSKCIKSVYVNDEAALLKLVAQAFKSNAHLTRAGAKAAKAWINEGTVSKNLSLKAQMDNWMAFS